MARSPRRRIGDILVESGIITPEQLAKALERQRRTRDRLGRVLVELNMASERQIAEALAEQLALPIVNLPSHRIDPEAVRLVPEAVARKRRTVPLAMEAGNLVVAMADPLDIFALDDVGIAARRPVKAVVAVESEIQTAIERAYGMGSAAQAAIGEIADEADAADQAMSATVKETEDGPVVRLVNILITQALKDRASDIHVEPAEDEVHVRFRIDGVMQTVMNVPKTVHPGLLTRLKVLSRLNIAEKRLPQDGAFEMAVDGREIDFRLATIPTIHGERAALRLLDKGKGILTLEELGMDLPTRQRYSRLAGQPYGIILVSGPTGSGKTTTLVSTLSQLNSAEKNIMTIEDPVEYQLPGVSHIQVNPRAGLTFATGLRSIVRQDPDIVMVGEIRDVETADIAIHASLTGHLVLTTIHTNDAPSALTRLQDMGIEPYLIASAVVGVVSQRLVRKLCPHCRQPDEVPPDVTEWLRTIVKDLPAEVKLFRPGGCPRCKESGYIGRSGIFEVLTMTEGLRKLVLSHASAAELADASARGGMTTMRMDGMLKALAGLTTVEEVLRVTRVEEPNA